MDTYNKYEYHVTDMLRGFSRSFGNAETITNDEQDYSIWQAANRKAEGEKNKTAVTVMLEDFADIQDSYKNGRSCINVENTRDETGILSFIFGDHSDNIFKSYEARENIYNEHVFYQDDIFADEVRHNGGIQYAQEGDNKYEAALNFAKADINAIETSYNNCNVDRGKGKQLEAFEIKTYQNKDTIFSINDSMDDVSLDGKTKGIKPEEYASYIIAVDGIVDGQADGKITAAEVEKVRNTDFDEIKSKAQTIYDNNYD